jgi:hypothetical protein
MFVGRGSNDQGKPRPQFFYSPGNAHGNKEDTNTKDADVEDTEGTVYKISEDENFGEGDLDVSEDDEMV